INVVGGPDMRMREIQEAASLIQEQAHEDANIIFGASIDESMADTLKVTVIATGFDRVPAEDGLSLEATRGLGRSASQSSVPVSRELSRPASEAPAYSTRRPPSSPALSVGLSAAPAPAVRDRITFPSQIDTDWDTPAYQRRQSSG